MPRPSMPAHLTLPPRVWYTGVVRDIGVALQVTDRTRLTVAGQTVISRGHL